MYTLRTYQQKAVNIGVQFFMDDKDKRNGYMVLPTGSGKSLVIGNIAKYLPGDTLVLQPSKEILEQNHQKILDFGVEEENVGIYSASCGQKDIKKITFATIGSIIKQKEDFSHFENIIIDECHFCNPLGGMYEEFLEDKLDKKVLGVTATPFRLHSKRYANGAIVVEAKFLHRTRPRIFTRILHATQVGELYKEGFLCPIQYDIQKGYDQKKLVLNSTGMDWLDESIREYNSKVGLVKFVENAITKHNARHTLVFCKFIEEADVLREDLEKKGISSAIVTGQTKKKERAQILKDFKEGKIKVVTNVGVLTTGFDFPELDCIILARPTQSVGLYYQIIGRGIRLSPEKQFCTVVDLCGNVERFGRVENFEIVAEKIGLERMKSERQWLTGWNFYTNKDLEEERERLWGDNADKKGSDDSQGYGMRMPFGKFKGKFLNTLPDYYIKWGCKNMKGKILSEFQKVAKKKNICL